LTEDDILQHFEEWEGGFAWWAIDELDETIEQLENQDLQWLAKEVLYSVNQDERHRGKGSIEVVVEWLDYYRDELLKELRDLKNEEAA
jgi:hypothetical protein